MAEHYDIGKRGEILAAEFLVKQGYVLAAMNWRYKSLKSTLLPMTKKPL
jgi:hypothetical protein